MSFRIVVGINRHNIPTHTPHSGDHGVTEVANPANIAKMAQKCINCISARPTPPHTNPMESGPGNTFSTQNQKKPKGSRLSTPKRGGSFFDPAPLTTTHLPQKLQKVGFKWGGSRGSGPKTHWGMRLLDKIMILQGAKLTIQYLGVGYANRPKKAKMGWYVVFSPIYACLALI